MQCISSKRIVFLDYLRVVACFIVMAIHASEPFHAGCKFTLFNGIIGIN